jgi:hypothetical protein
VKERALEIAKQVPDPIHRMNVLREYIQASVLRSLHESQAFQSLSFVGGTALRFLYDLPRFSEDLDFTLESSTGYQPQDWLGKLKRDLGFAGFDPDVTWNQRKTVQVGWVRVPGLLSEAGLAALEDQKLSIKIEIDTQPPEGAITENRALNRHFLVAFRHHDLPSLMAGKIHALIARDYTKGRDWYDLLWYCTRTPVVLPNETLLQAAFDQTEGAGTHEASGWVSIVSNALDKVSVLAIRDDVSPFLERPEEANLLSEEYLRKMLEDRI